MSRKAYNFKDITGNKYGRLTVIERVQDHIQPNGQHIVRWLCKCDCGNTKIVYGSKLRNGHTISCGCWQKDNPPQKTHGNRHTRLYNIWATMKQRCYCKSYHEYNTYGKRGIMICDEWLNNFKSFYDWAMNNGYKDDLTIDRINVNGDYEPSNCRWATIKEQQNNRRNNHLITYNGKTRTIAQWADELKMSYNKLYQRLYKGWNIEKALNTP